MQLLLGKPVYVEDIVPKDALALKLLRSPHANAIVEEINVSVAKKVPGVVDIYTWEDAVSYTHLDVYKRQPVPNSSRSFVTSFTSACSISRSTISSLNGIKSKT